MFTITRTPLTSPALRTASAYATAPSSPLSRTSYSPLPKGNSFASLRKDSYTSSPGSATLGCYFNLNSAPPSPCKSDVSHSPRFLALPHIAVPTSPVLFQGNVSLGLIQPIFVKERINPNSSTARPKPTFKLVLPRPHLVRDDSFETAVLTGINLTPGTPCDLAWSGSCDSVMTLKPTKGRIPTPYPQSDESEWIRDVDEAIRDDVQRRLA